MSSGNPMSIIGDALTSGLNFSATDYQSPASDRVVTRSRHSTCKRAALPNRTAEMATEVAMTPFGWAD
jgi:hypothetical protein